MIQVSLSTTLSDFCDRLLVIDRGIRFVGIANDKGRLIAHTYRKDVMPLLTPDETERSVFAAALRTGTRTMQEDKLGETMYSCTVYKKVKRATIPLYDHENHILLASFDVDTDHESIIQKILHELRR